MGRSTPQRIYCQVLPLGGGTPGEISGNGGAERVAKQRVYTSSARVATRVRVSDSTAHACALELDSLALPPRLHPPPNKHIVFLSCDLR